MSEDGIKQSPSVAHKYRILSGGWAEKASQNVDEWGLQDEETLLLAMQEEMGELTQAYLESRAEDGDRRRISEELSDLAALCFQLQWALNDCTLNTAIDHDGGDDV